MSTNLGYLFSGIQMVVNPHLFISLSWQIASVTARACTGLMWLWLIWFAIRIKIPARGILYLVLVAAVILGAQVDGALKDLSTSIQIKEHFTTLTNLQISANVGLLILSFGGLILGCGLRKYPFC